VTSIGRNAFIWCRSLTSITIPKENVKLLNGTFGDEKVKLLVNGRKRTIHPLKNAQTPAKSKPEKKQGNSPLRMGAGSGAVGYGRVVGSAVGSAN